MALPPSRAEAQGEVYPPAVATGSGRESCWVSLGLHQLQFHFHPAGSISVEGGWELRDAADGRLDGRHDGPERPPYHLHRLLGRRVARSEVSAPDWFALRFALPAILARVVPATPVALPAG